MEISKITFTIAVIDGQHVIKVNGKDFGFDEFCKKFIYFDDEPEITCTLKTTIPGYLTENFNMVTAEKILSGEYRGEFRTKKNFPVKIYGTNDSRYKGYPIIAAIMDQDENWYTYRYDTQGNIFVENDMEKLDSQIIDNLSLVMRFKPKTKEKPIVKKKDIPVKNQDKKETDETPENNLTPKKHQAFNFFKTFSENENYDTRTIIQTAAERFGIKPKTARVYFRMFKKQEEQSAVTSSSTEDKTADKIIPMKINEDINQG